MELKNKKTVVVGLGKTGCDTAIFLQERGAEVSVTESGDNPALREKARLLSQRGIKIEMGGHTEKFISKADAIITSPGVPDHSLPLKLAGKKNLPVLSEIELAYIFSPSKKIIAITGTNGKTTTASILGLFFHKAKLPSVVCGNIGNTFIGALKNLKKDTFVILEVSNFQLEKTKLFRPYIGCLLNIDEDHLDRHFSLANYIEAKKRIFSNQNKSDLAVINYDDYNCRAIGQNLKSKTFFFSQAAALEEGAYLKGNKIISVTGNSKAVFKKENIQITGRGNNENIMAAVLAGRLCNIEAEIIQDALYEFKPLPHRFEKTAVKKGVVFINDSKATNPHSVINALKSLEPGRETILIMGGQNKNVSFSKLIPLIRKHVKLLILLGEAKETIADQLSEVHIPRIFAADMKEAVRKGAENSKNGDIVLLAPGCASFDMFMNYKERGDVFKKEVELLL